MATNYWLGVAPLAAQVSTAVISGYDAGTTYKVTIGGVTISQVGTGGTVSTTATAIVALLNASTHPYFSGITWTANGSAGAITGTADTAGCPFTAVASVTGAGGTIGAFSDTVANSGPNDWSVAANWSLGAVPVDTNDVVLKDSSVNICWGLSQSSIDPASLQVYQSYTGRIGLDYQKFATSADGTTTVATANEYRENYLILGTITLAELGKPTGVGSPAGSGRILLDSAFALLTCYNTASNSADSGRPAVRLKTTATGDVNIRQAPGGIGIACEEPGEVSTIDDLALTDTGSNTTLVLSQGVTMGDLSIAGGTTAVNAAATIPVVTVSGGTVTLEGDYTVTAMNVSGGTVRDNHIKTAAAAVTTLNLSGGTVNHNGSNASRTVTTLVQTGGSLISNGSVVSIGTVTEPTASYTMTVA